MPAEPEDHKKAVESFVWTSPTGKKVKFKSFLKMPVKVFDACTQTDDDLKRTFILLRAAVDAEGYELLGEEPLDALNQIMEDWQRASGVELPES